MWLLEFEALSLPHRYADIVREHRAILNAIERENSEDARRAAHEHILQTARAADHLDR